MKGSERRQAIVTTTTTSPGRAHVDPDNQERRKSQGHRSRQTFHMRLVNRRLSLRLCRGCSCATWRPTNTRRRLLRLPGRLIGGRGWGWILLTCRQAGASATSLLPEAASLGG